MRAPIVFNSAASVPGAWQASMPELARYAGVAWYRRAIEIPTSWRDVAIAVRFGAVDYRCTAWLDESELGSHEGGYDPFEFELPGDVAAGEHLLTLRVDDPADQTDLPHGKQGDIWYTRVSGPWQSIALVARPRERVERLQCRPDVEGAAVDVDFSLCLASPQALLRLRVVRPDESVAASADVMCYVVHGSAHLSLPQPHLWEPDDPFVYTIQAALETGGAVVDETAVRFGLRSIEIRDGGIRLNGHPLEVRGALDQAYWPDTLYTPPGVASIDDEILLAKRAGLNLLRKHIKPEDPRYLDRADELGMLIWAEPACPDRPSFDGSREAVRRDLRAMIERDFNHPSVVIWSCYNEDWGIPDLANDAEQQRWLHSIVAEVRALDPTRLVCDNSGWAHVGGDLNDYHEYFSLPERYPQFIGRLDEIAADPDANFAAGSAADRPQLITEFGAWSLPNPQVARDRAGGADPAWFGHGGCYQLPPGHEVVRTSAHSAIATIAGFEERLRESGATQWFGPPAAVLENSQRRALRSLRAQIEAFRTRPELAGYVVTELTDTEWEGNGWLDYWREPKPFFERLPEFNGDLIVVGTPEQRTLQAGDTARVALFLVNATPIEQRGVIRSTLDGESAGPRCDTAIQAWSRAHVGSIEFEIPDGPPRQARLALEFTSDTGRDVHSEIELVLAPRDRPLSEPVNLDCWALERLPRLRLEQHGYRRARADQRPTLAVVKSLDPERLSWIAAGGRALYLADADVLRPNPLDLRFIPLPAGESWEMHSGVAWANTGRLAPVPLCPELGWEAVSFFPRVSFDARSLAPGDEQLSGWLEGWAAFPGAFAIVRMIGRGRLLATTFRLEESVGLDPIATMLFDRFVEIVREVGHAGDEVAR
jgi:hypothetical protein